MYVKGEASNLPRKRQKLSEWSSSAFNQSHVCGHKLHRFRMDDIKHEVSVFKDMFY